MTLTLRPRDYKQHAIQVLVQKGIVRAAEGGKLYLVEDRFDERLRYPKRGREADPQPTR